MPPSLQSATSKSTSSRTTNAMNARPSSKTSTGTPRNASKPALKVVHKFADGTQHVLTLEEQIFQLLQLYARMYVSEDPVLRKTGGEKLREVANIVAKSESASVFGKLLKEKQVEKLNHKNDDYLRFLESLHGITNTKTLAGLLQNRFEINSFRSCLDTVRAWKKKLRAAR